jgi:hypothetical protein
VVVVLTIAQWHSSIDVYFVIVLRVLAALLVHMLKTRVHGVTPPRQADFLSGVQHGLNLVASL